MQYRDAPQVVGEFRRRGVPPRRFSDEAPQADAIQNGRERWPDGGGGKDRGVSDTQPLQEAHLLEGQAPRQGVVQDRTNPVDINGRADPMSPVEPLLGRHVAGVAHHRTVAGRPSFRRMQSSTRERK
jgi:hypothetical protein